MLDRVYLIGTYKRAQKTERTFPDVLLELHFVYKRKKDVDQNKSFKSKTANTYLLRRDLLKVKKKILLSHVKMKSLLVSFLSISFNVLCELNICCTNGSTLVELFCLICEDLVIS